MKENKSAFYCWTPNPTEQKVMNTTTFYKPNGMWCDILRVTAKNGVPTEVGWLECDQSSEESEREKGNALARKQAIDLFHSLYSEYEVQCTIMNNDSSGRMSAPVEKKGSKSLRTSDF